MPSFRNASPMCAYSTPVDINDGTKQLCAANPPNSLLPQWILLGGEPTIVFDAPRPGDIFTIAAAGPKMPQIAVSLRLAGILPDPSDRTEFRVEAQVEFDSADCPDGTKKNGTSTKLKSAKPTVMYAGGGNFTLVLTEILGGNLKLKVSAAVGGANIKAELAGVRIQGEDPGADQIKAQLTEKIVWRIAQHESHGGHQFAAAPLAGGAAYPLYSGDRKLGVGLGQITKLAGEAPLTTAEVWDWTANLASAEAKLRQTRRVSDNFVKHVRNSEEFKQLITAYNADRVAKKLAVLTVTLPDLTADQRERDAVRGYNGFAGSDELCTDQQLHEYRVAQKDGLLVVDVVAGMTTGKAKWEVVPPEDRPDSGDPDYVKHVYAKPA